MMGKTLLKWTVRAAGSVVALIMIFWLLPREAILAGFASVSLPLFVGVFATFLAGHCANALKWWLLIDRGISYPVALRAHFGGLAANLCLPGAAGGDAARAALAHLAMRDGPRLAAGAVADRLIDLIGMACLSLTGLLLIRGQTLGAGLVIEIAGILAVGLVFIVYGFPALVRAIWLGRPGLAARSLALRTAEAFSGLGRRPGLLVATLTLSLAIQGVFVWLSAQLGIAAGVEIPFAAWLFAWPLAKVVAVLPISLNGLGVRESSLAALLVPFGAGAAEVVASGLVWQAVIFGAGMLGAAVLLISGGRLVLPTKAVGGTK